MIKYLLTLLLFISSGLLSAQEVTSTGNIVDPTKWNNVIPMTSTQLSQVEGTGGGPLPAYNTDTNTIRFSFMPYTVSQIIAINSVLSGQGISVGGFNYSWKIYNDLENCCGTRGMLMGNVSLYNKGGNLLNSYNYDYSMTNTGAAFQTFTGIETFNNPYQLNSLGDISVSWFGRDINFWSGYYGPRVRETSITLNYTAASPPPAPTTSTSTTQSTAQTTTAEIIAKAAEPVTEPTTTNTTTTQSSPSNEPVVASNTTTTSPSTNTIVGVVDPNAVSTALSVIKEEQTKESVSEKPVASGPSLSSILANIKSNQEKQQSIAMTAVASSIEVANSVTQKAEQLAVEAAQASAQQALQTAANSSTMTGGNRSVNNGMSVMDNNRQSQATNNSQINVLPGVNNNSAVFDLFARPESKNITPSAVAMNDYSLRPQTNIATSQYVAPSVSLIRPEIRQSENVIDNQFITPEIKPILRQPTIELFANNNNMSVSNNTIAFGRKGDPIQDYIEANNAMFNEMKTESRPTAVRSNVQDNDIAGGVKIERMAIVPNGFNAYSAFILTNIAFYEPKEIYKNNVPKDNVRSMYFLEKGNTDTYNKMIEGQYK
jgi:hypothetical protein